MQLMLKFLLLTCVTSASLLPLDPTSALNRRERNSNNLAFGDHTSHGLPMSVLAHPGHVGIFAAKTVPDGSINPVNFIDPVATGYVRPMPYSYGAHPPVVHNPQIGLQSDGPVAYPEYRYPVIEMPQHFRMH